MNKVNKQLIQKLLITSIDNNSIRLTPPFSPDEIEMISQGIWDFLDTERFFDKCEPYYKNQFSLRACLTGSPPLGLIYKLTCANTECCRK